jgi:hypothetical protein
VEGVAPGNRVFEEKHGEAGGATGDWDAFTPAVRIFIYIYIVDN